MDKQEIRERILKVPIEIKSWLSSDAVIDQIDEINQEFNLVKGDEMRIIPRLLLRLEIKDLQPEDFEKELTVQFQGDNQKAKVAFSKIKKIILFPIKTYFKNYGINIIFEVGELNEEMVDLRFKESQQSITSNQRQENQGKKSENQEILQQNFADAKAVADGQDITGLASSGTISDRIDMSNKTNRTDVVEEGPAIIHEEKEFKSIPNVKGSLSGIFGFMTKGSEKKEPEKVMAEIEMGGKQSSKTYGQQPPASGEQIGADKINRFNRTDRVDRADENPLLMNSNEDNEEAKMRVVNYSEFRTPIGIEDDKGQEVKSKETQISVGDLSNRIDMSKRADTNPPNFSPERTVSVRAGLLERGQEEEIVNLKTSPQPSPYQGEGVDLTQPSSWKGEGDKPPEPSFGKGAGEKKDINEVKLEDIPVKEDTIDLRNI